MAEYDAAIRRESSVVAESILDQWPDYESMDFREEWFDKSECNRRIKEYAESISRNIKLKEYALQSQSILQHYRNILIPAAVPYVFSPQLSPAIQRHLLCSIRDVLMSRTNVPTASADKPFPGRTTPSAKDTESRLPPAGSDNLGILIEELRDSPQPLLQLYGNELSKSYREQLGQNTSQSTRCRSVVRAPAPLSRRVFSKKRQTIFRNFGNSYPIPRGGENQWHCRPLAPDYPSIHTQSTGPKSHRRTSRSVEIVITRYAVVLLKYQQSIRLLELLSIQKHEEILREIEAIRNDVLVESTPDWLLVQVSPLRRRSDCVRLI
jgi:hypothetical protein